MILVDLVKTVYLELKKKKLMADKMAVDKEMQVLKVKKQKLQAEYNKI